MVNLPKKTNRDLVDSYDSLVSKKPLKNKSNLDYYQNKAIELGASKAILINPDKDCIFEERVKLLCANSCGRYGLKLSCPPYIPDINYEKAIKEYNFGLIIMIERNAKTSEQFKKTRLESTNSLHKILLELENEAFKEGEFFATSFIGGSCKLCNECYNVCKNPTLSRIPLEATGMNIVKTLKNIGEEIKFPIEKYKKFSRTGLFLLSE